MCAFLFFIACNASVDFEYNLCVVRILSMQYVFRVDFSSLFFSLLNRFMLHIWPMKWCKVLDLLIKWETLPTIRLLLCQFSWSYMNNCNNNIENVSTWKPKYRRMVYKKKRKYMFEMLSAHEPHSWTGLNINLKYRLLGSFSVRMVFLCCRQRLLLSAHFDVNLTNGVVVFMWTYVPFVVSFHFIRLYSMCT